MKLRFVLLVFAFILIPQESISNMTCKFDMPYGDSQKEILNKWLENDSESEIDTLFPESTENDYSSGGASYLPVFIDNNFTNYFFSKAQNCRCLIFIERYNERLYLQYCTLKLDF